MRYQVSLFFLLISIGVHGQGFLKTSGSSIVNGSGKEVILRGIGLGGWMLQEPYMMQLSGTAVNQRDIKSKLVTLVGAENTQKFYDTWLANQMTKADVDSMAAWGLNSIRLPLHYNLFTLAVEEEPIPGQNTWITKGFDLTDSLLSWCRQDHIYLILDLHTAPGGQGNDIAISDRDKTAPSLWDSEPNKQKTIALWQKLATRYANEEWIGGYDLINEPNFGFQSTADKNGCAEKGNKPLKKLLQDITAAVRKVDKKHLIFIEGNCWANNYEGMFPLWDKNIVISFHKYWNSTGTASIQKFLNYRKTYKVPLWLGETGENSNTWLTNAIQLCENNKIGWSLWPLKKSGLNNPLQIKLNAGFQEIIDYWKDSGPRPARDRAFSALMRYAVDSRNENNSYRKDVTDAITRQVRSADLLPYKAITVKPGAMLFAADYDLGRSGKAYHDNDSATYWVDDKNHAEWNKGKLYRNDGVDIEQCRDAVTNGFDVGWIEDGEWLQYSVYAPEATTMDVNVRCSSPFNVASLRLYLNGASAGSDITLPNTGSYLKWATSTIKNISFTKGWNHIKVLAVTGGFDFNYLKFTQPQASTTTAAPTTDN